MAEPADPAHPARPAAPASRTRWLLSRVRSVRVRVTAAVVVVLAVVAVAGAWALVAALGRTLTTEVVSAARLRAGEIVRELEAGASVRQLEISNEEDRFVQVLAPDATVLLSAPEPASPALPDPPTASQEDVVESSGSPGEPDETYLVVAAVATEVGRQGQDLTVLVGQESETVDEATGALTGTLRPAVPLAVALAGLATWVLVGRALAPVESIRTQVDGISADRLDTRVPVPDTGDELARLATTMNAMLTRLEQAQARQRQFVSDASHELRSPATAIRQHAEVAVAHPGSTSADELARTVLAEGHRLEQLVAHLLLLARLDEHVPAADRTARPVDLDDLVLEEADRVRTTTDALVDTSAVSAGAVRGDHVQLRSLVANLLDNGARHARTAVKVALADVDGQVQLTVADDGPGIAVGDRERVLERFVRLDDARTRARGGAGLGLAIVRAVADAHGGTVHVGATGSGGARLDVRLPAADDPRPT